MALLCHCSFASFMSTEGEHIFFSAGELTNRVRVAKLHIHTGPSNSTGGKKHVDFKINEKKKVEKSGKEKRLRLGVPKQERCVVG